MSDLREKMADILRQPIKIDLATTFASVKKKEDRRVDQILVAFKAHIEGCEGPENPFPEAFWPGDEKAPNDIWEPVFTQNTLNGWGHDGFKAALEAYCKALLESLE